MAGHHEIEPFGDRRAERCEFDGVEPSSVAVDEAERMVRVDRAPALARKVLCRGRDAGGSQAAHRCGHHARHGSRLGPETADPERRVVPCRDHIGHRCVADVDAHRGQLEADRLRHSLGQRHVAGRAERHRAGERRRSLAERLELAAFLVGRDQERQALGRARLQRVGKRPDLLRRADVEEAEQREPGRRGFVEPGIEPIRDRRLAFEGEHEQPEDVVAPGFGHPFTDPVRSRFASR